MNYWIYENWTVVKGGRTTIHIGECVFCNDGRGVNKIKEPEKNGKWHGPFDNYEEAQKRAEELRGSMRNCNKCIKK